MVVNQRAFENHQQYGDGEDGFSKGYFVEPTIVEGLSEDHEMVKRELFLPMWQGDWRTLHPGPVYARAEPDNAGIVRVWI
jgi:hypothetical protein